MFVFVNCLPNLKSTYGDLTEVLVSYLATSIAFFSNSFNLSISEL